MGCGDDTGDVVLDDQGDDVNDHADTIRRAIMCSLYNTGRTIKGTPYSHDDYDAAHSSLDALLAENQQLADRAVCSGCGSDVDEGGICHYEGCDDGQMIPASDLPGALREACDAQSEQWREHAEEVKEMRAENQRLEAERDLAETYVPVDAWTEYAASREALAGDTG